ncbi:hypothetical protein CEP51_011486 [Fusarium floridanum]|uniref:Zn(2)-C6 fungal-type domain-containing protein n=1 Tax=Fusarium floridanum TaxID=1325733 RepID=A0A428RAY7_9HYPO|nr:hypothetical protein CEP51_011486 [Fusarium floridanum]
MENLPGTDAPDRGAGAGTLAPPRKFTIRSKFGQARKPRSRKNRPCDACRRRKTACVITSEPPCLFCKSRGLVCQSLSDPEAMSMAPRANTQSVPPSSSSPASPSISAISPSAASESNPQRAESAAVVHDGLVRQSGPGPVGQESVASAGVDSPMQDPADEIVHTLEDEPDKTTHAMGLAAEQDPYFLDAFRSLLLSEREGIDASFVQVYPGGQDPDDHPIHFLLLQDEFPAHKNQAKQAASDAIESFVWPHGPALVRLYFRHVHSAFPVISKGRFLRQYLTAKLDIPSSLRGAVYALACVFWRKDPSLEGPCPFQQHDLINHAQESLRRELESPNLWRLQASLLLMHMVPPDIDSVETPYTWIMAAQATAAAQMIGLHQDPAKWSIAPWEKKLRRKLWWATYFTDCWSAVCHGNPPHIAADTFTTPPPDLEDLRSDEDLPLDLHHMVDPCNTSFRVPDGVRFLEMINIARDTRVILDCSCGVRATVQTRTQLIPIREKLREWPSLMPSCLAVGPNTSNGPLHLSYYATHVLLFRGLMYPATKAAKATPGSNLRRWLSTALAEFDNFTAFMAYITDNELTSFWGRHARSQLILCGNFLIYLFLLATEPRDVEAAYRLLEKFHLSLQRLGATEDIAAKVLLRPVILRIESFFIQATELIKTGRTVESPVLYKEKMNVEVVQATSSRPSQIKDIISP